MGSNHKYAQINQISFWVLYLWGQLYFIRDGGAYLLDGKVIGYSWYNYLRQAWLIERRISRHYNYFREPLYGGIIGEIGEHTSSYADVAILISSLSGSLAALFLGFSIWTCFPKNGAFWGGFASLSVFLSAGYLPVGRWGNHYSFLILGMTFLFWSLFRAIQNGKGWLLVAFSLGLACSIDQRSFLWSIPVFLLAFFSTEGWKLRFLRIMLSIGGGWWMPRFFRWYFAEDPKHRLSFSQVLAFQREVVSRWAAGEQGVSLHACSSLSEQAYLRLTFFGSSCSREILTWNWNDKITGFSSFPFVLILVAFGGLFLVALRKNSKLFWRKWFLLFSIVGMVFFWSAIMPLPTRYLPSICIGLVLIVPFLFSVFEEGKGVWISWAFRGLALSSSLYLCYVGVDAQRSRIEMHRQVREQQEYWQIWQILQRYREKDSFLDCGEHGLNSLILPQRYVSMPFHQIKNSSFCEEWIEKGNGDWILLRDNSSLLQKIEQQTAWRNHYQSKEMHFSLWRFERPN